MEYKFLNGDSAKVFLDTLRYHRMTIATAESCTGGLIASKLCEVPGISEFFKEGFVTYAREAKEKTLGVAPEIIDNYGIVSCETAEAMAQGATNFSGCRAAVATTGVAGPDGGTKETPAGCVCFGFCVDGVVSSYRRVFSGNREEVRAQAALEGLQGLYSRITDLGTDNC